MNETQRGSSVVGSDAERGHPHGIVGVHGVRYRVKDVFRLDFFSNLLRSPQHG